MDNSKDIPETAASSPVAWFAILQIARQKHDLELTIKAKRELERRGVIVTFRRVDGGRP